MSQGDYEYREITAILTFGVTRSDEALVNSSITLITRLLTPVKFFLLSSLRIANDHSRMKNIEFKNVLIDKTIDAFKRQDKYSKDGGILRRTRSVLSAFCLIEM